ncbi:MAG: toll/interleukin-1 receptor domain-containing protein [Anaerolineae bacterium]
MADVFISYSRKNADFVMRLYETLERHGREVWLDLDSIPKGEEFNKMIFDGIDAADVVLFVVSRYSLTSEICNTEIAYARSRNKKIIPVMLEAMDDRNPDSEVFMAVLAGWYKKKYASQAQENWEVLRMINWAIFTADRDFDTEFKILLQEIETDRPHVRQHTRYIVAARDWKNAEYTPEPAEWGANRSGGKMAARI